MTKKKTSLVVSADLSDLFSDASAEITVPERKINTDTYPIEKALKTIIRQLEAIGLRERTISDYKHHVSHFAEITGIEALEDITADHIYDWLASMNVSNQTKLTRLKCLKAFLGRCFDNGWIASKFWAQIRIKVDSPVKPGATERDIMLLLSLLDLSDFVQLRDATAVLLLYQTGIRISTLAQLESHHVDLETNTLRVDGGLLKNHEQIHLPFDDKLSRLLEALMRQNRIVRRENGAKNDFIFITRYGEKVTSSQSHNNIQKRLNKYSKEYGIKNLNPHALRRGFARRLLDKNANIALISKALGHSDIDVTSRYLHLDKEEVMNSLRQYL
ncbi:tyrosine-type recombinase/integrase [Halalkalibacter flavus]|uniref:tyrosine-type recombinase/integrase n=1 Tax=Halalkalibacter flavus TaxID=3090668 RepID=UPI002FC945CE